MNNKAKTEFSLPHNNKSGTNINSKIFIVATTVIWIIALILVLNLVKIQTAITTSESPI